MTSYIYDKHERETDLLPLVVESYFVKYIRIKINETIYRVVDLIIMGKKIWAEVNADKIGPSASQNLLSKKTCYAA